MEHWATAIAILVTLIDFACAGHALLNKREPRAALGWFGVCLLVPLLGAILYVLFGINRVQARARREGLHDRHQPAAADRPKTVEGVPGELVQLARLSASLQRWPLTTGNRVEVLHHGEHTYPAMLAAIESARERVFLSSYIFDTGKTGQRFVDALAAARDRGADVRVLVDGVGELYAWPRISRALGRRKLEVRRFNPPSLLPPSLQINLRNHRKVLVADRRVAFAGGMNIGDRHVDKPDGKGRGVVDVHFRFEGPIIGQLVEVFLEDWERATGEEAPAAPEMDLPAADGTAICRALTDGPGENMDKLTMVLTGAVSLARKEILVMTPYFLPPRELQGALVAAALRGVEVSIILPAKNNLPPVHWATRRMLWELLRHEVRVYYQPGPFVHSKLFVVDGEYVQIGSANLDPRSLRLNFELAVEIYDRALAADLSGHCRAALVRSREESLAALDGRPLWQRLRDSIAWLFSPYL